MKLKSSVSATHNGIRTLLLLSAIFVTSLPAPAPVAAQDSGPRALEIADYRHWRSVDDATISDDGNWVAWSYGKLRADAELHIRSMDGVTHTVERGTDPVFSDDGRWIAYFISPPIEEVLQLERDDEEVTRHAGLMSLATGEQRSWENAENFGFAPGSTHFHVRRAQADDDADHNGTDLILRNLSLGFDELIGSVDQAAYNESGSHLAFTVDAADMEGNGLYAIDLSTGARRGLDNAKARYSRMIWDESGATLAVLRGDTPDDKVERENTLVTLHNVGGQPVRTEIEATQGLEDGWVISNRAAVRFNEDATMVFIGSRPQADELEDWDDAEGLPLADVNIWHWNDDRIQTEQQSSAGRDRNKTWVAAVDLEGGSILPLADEQMENVEITRDGRWAIGRDGSAYVSDWEPSYGDFYRIDTRTGVRTPVMERQLRTFGLSPDSQNYLYWKDGHVWVYDLGGNEHRNLTASAPVSFVDQEYDYFGERPIYGIGGWTEDGRAVILYDRFDVWRQPLNGDQATNLTGGRGAEDEIRFRIIRTDPDARTVDLDAPIMLEGFGEFTKDEGFFRLDGDNLEALNWGAHRLGAPQKAADADRFLYTIQSWEQFPDIWVADEDFDQQEQISNANPQQDDYLWGRRILFNYETSDGIPLQGTLAIPETYQEGDKLPMVVRFYEKYSQDLHAYPTPAYRHQPNFAGYVSNGYLLMQPDVHFRIGSSHSDMLEAVEAAVQAVIDLGYADPGKVGLSGHSYSGGGGAYIATRSEMFAAVAHGAAPINLVSEFNQLWVGSGVNNHNYDIYGQGRYATNPYDDFDLYWDQSPISGVEDMNTPVLYLHGEADPIVNWEQGLEWYNALRFLKKPIIWLSYPGEGHGLRRLENQIDFQYRLRQFFDHHLKGEPAPDWMTEGVDYLGKDQHLREFAPRIFRSGTGTRPITDRDG